MKAVDLLVKTNNPASLDKTVQCFGAAVVGGGEPGGYVKEDGCYVVRCFTDPDFLVYVIERQGYGRVQGRKQAES